MKTTVADPKDVFLNHFFLTNGHWLEDYQRPPRLIIDGPRRREPTGVATMTDTVLIGCRNLHVYMFTLQSTKFTN